MTGNAIFMSLEQIGAASVDVQITSADASCLHTDKDFPKARLRLRKVLNGRSSITQKNDAFHLSLAFYV
jgi:hypothetical protein